VLAVKETLERELKLSADRAFRLPKLPGQPLESRIFTSTYYDTADFRLVRYGVTLRRRVERGRGLWQLKLPRGLARLELELRGGPSRPPEALRDLLLAHTRGRDLVPIAKLRSRRAGVRVRDVEGPLADVVVDSVAVLEGRRVARRLHEVEVELTGGDEKALRRIERALRAAGAADGDGRPKLFQALGLEPPPSPGPVSPAAFPVDHLKAMLQGQVAALLAHDPGTRHGTDPEELHQMRVANRRLRALLRAARPMLDPEWVAALRTELGWLGSVLGPVRDLDVLVAHLRSEAASLDAPERRAFERLLGRLAAERAEARATMLEALRSERYLRLLDGLEDAVREPRVVTPDISLHDLAAGEFKKLRRAVRALGDEPSDEELHAVRIRGKRARYAAELAEATAGKPASRFIRRAKAFQDLLGEHQDAVVAEERIRQLVSRVRGLRTAFAAGRLVERQRARWQAARAAFAETWERLEQRGRRAWT